MVDKFCTIRASLD